MTNQCLQIRRSLQPRKAGSILIYLLKLKIFCTENGRGVLQMFLYRSEYTKSDTYYFVRKSTAKYYKNEFRNFSNDLKRIWVIINEITGRKKIW